MDAGRQRELLPHYVAVVLLVGGSLAAVRAVLGSVAPWVAVPGVVVVVLGYPTAVRSLGFAPSAWEEPDGSD